MNVLDDVFVQQQPLLNTGFYMLVGFVVVNDLVNFPQLLATYGQPFLQYHLGFQKRKRVTFNRCGVMRILQFKCLYITFDGYFRECMFGLLV
ncbi:hypothetical protein D3C73_1069040 [compost metagenome]